MAAQVPVLTTAEVLATIRPNTEERNYPVGVLLIKNNRTTLLIVTTPETDKEQVF